MRTQLSEPLPDALVHSIAAQQHGVACRAQLLAGGISAGQITLRLGDGRLTALHRGVYLVGAVASQHAFPQAALFACGPTAVLSHRSAAAIWNLLPYPARAQPWITVTPEKRIVRPRIVVRRAPLGPHDIRARFKLRVVSPPRTILDGASLLTDEHELEALVAEAAYRRLASEAELRDQVQRNAGRPGVAALRSVLGLEGGPRHTRSGGERWFLDLLRRHRIKGYEVNVKVHDREVDFLWRQLGFCVELDGWDGHSSRVAFDRDRLKWAYLQANGVTVMPLSARQAQRDETGTIERLRQALARRA